MNFKKYLFNITISLLLILSYLGNDGQNRQEPTGMEDQIQPNIQIAAEVPEPTGALCMILGGILWHRRYKRKP